MAALERVQVLLEPRQRRALAHIAKRDGRSISELLREMIDQGLEHRARESEQWREALQRLASIRQANGAKALRPGNLVAQAREERERQMDKIWRK